MASFLFLIVSMFIASYAMDTSIDISGDLEIIGMFSIHESDEGECSSDIKVSSVMAAEAVKWYIRQLNKHASLPVTIGFKALDTCRLTTRAAQQAVNLMNQVLNNETYIIGVVGPKYSSEAEVISPILGSVPARYRLPQVGFSTTAESLSDSEKYPNFIRVIPPDDVQVEAMVKTMIELSWNRIAVLYTDDSYGKDAFTRLKQRTEEAGVCIALDRGLSVENGVNSVEIKNALNDIILGTGSRPSIEGLVFIGDSTTARTILITLKNLGLSSVPIVMLSEAFNMDLGVFKEPDGTIISKAKGSLALTPLYKQVDEFQAHWKGIFTDENKFENESSSNPWLREVNDDIKNCVAQSCLFQPMSETQYAAVFPREPLYIQYAVLATHALIKAAVGVHQSYCSSAGLCMSFKENFRAGDVLDALKGLQINLKTDFTYRLVSLSTAQYTYTIDSMGMLQQPAESSQYQLYNFRNRTSTSPGFDLVKVGELVNGKMNVSYAEIRDYKNGAVEKSWPDVRRPECPEQTLCSECLNMEEVQERVIFDPGDVYIIGIVPIFESSGIDGCGGIRTVSGYQSAESIRFGVQKVNEKIGEYTAVFQGVKVGLIILNSCNNPVVIQRKLHDLHTFGVKLLNGTTIDLRNKILGFVGDIGSSISIAAAEVLSRLQHVQISFASTSPALSDRNKYPYFMRVVTPDDAQARAMIDIVQQLQANFIQVVYSVGAYGEGGLEKVKETAKSNQVCVVNAIPVEEDGNSYEIYDVLRKNQHAKIVIIFLRSHKVFPVMKVLTSQMTKGEFIFIGSEAWARKTDALETDSKHVLLGSLTLSLEMYHDSELRTHIQYLKPLSKSVNPWVTLFLQARRKCYFDESFDKTASQLCPDVPDQPDFALDSWDTVAFVAAKSLLMGTSNFFQQKCGTTVKQLCDDFTSNPKGLIEEILKVRLDLDGSGNKQKVFDSNGDGNVGYRIYNIQRDEDNPQKLVYVEVGRFPLEGTFTFEKERLVSPTDEEIESVCPNEQVCAGCFPKTGGEEAVTGGDSRVLNTGMLALGVALAVAVIAVIVLTIVLVCWKRNLSKRESDIYIHPKACDEMFQTPRQEALGSEGFHDIPPCGDFSSINSIGTTEM